ncbi:hypothetical protein OBBRIDRAFT_729485 [Obba rivulosa]|uniref:Uncharacterized protein n=1 Tax=Obba rivulosa TaxID=1052685 RepID=A0A8E2AU78_9APHY|nr:hypothetical protein OBBRIDRAFT_729485 [Obba rivulosa]
MPFNLPGILVPLHLLINPRLIVPSIVIKDIRQLDFPELRRAGYRGAVFDKDNCLTVPHDDRLVPELQEAWRMCRETFGEGNVLIVSNTAGKRSLSFHSTLAPIDLKCIQAESVSHHLSVPVLRHPSLKPSYACIASIRAYFASLPVPIRDDELIIVGDRLLTDVVLANRIARVRTWSFRPAHSRSSNSNIASEKFPVSEKQASLDKEVSRPAGPLAVLTTGLWKHDAPVLRALERGLLRGVQRWVVRDMLGTEELRRFVQPLPPAEEPVKAKEGMFAKLWSRFRRP